MFKTRITELLGIRYPIIQGGLQWLSRAELAAAVSNAGGLGIITAASHATEEDLREEIRKVRELTDKPFGVNISMLPTTGPGDMTGRYLGVVVEEKVPVVETSGRSPEPLVPDFKAAGIKLIHKVPAVRYARKAEAVGADAVTIVGFECGGHPGMDDVTTFILIPRAVREVSIPVLAGGGVADARGFVAALALGADGVVMGTRFAATTEVVAHEEYKRALQQASETDTMIILRSIRNAERVLRNKTAEQVLSMEERGAQLAELMPLVSGRTGLKGLLEGRIEEAVFPIGQAVGLVQEIKPAGLIIEEIVSEARQVFARLEGILT